MRYLYSIRTFQAMLLSSFLFVVACNNEESKSDDTTSDAPAVNTPTVQPAQNLEIDENTAHYVCPSRCKGSGAEQKGTCPVCGSEYVHNPDAAFHKQQNPTPPPDANKLNLDNVQQLDVKKEGGEAGGTGPEYTSHFVCPYHCKGSGSAQQGNCSVCGTAYVHNANSDHHKQQNAQPIQIQQQ